ncbi:hypothetical protein DFJ74DRAFT_287356 [Hyaloraphidium curvatum]|nr:hypothetical protein DFJ74DRAFT_287356 [Hyaloraphidium curvatum]
MTVHAATIFSSQPPQPPKRRRLARPPTRATGAAPPSEPAIRAAAMEANPWLRERPRDPGTGRRPEVGVDDVVVLLVKLLQRYSDQDDELNGRQVALEPLLPQLPWFRGTPLLLRTDIGEEHVELLVQFIRAFGAFSSMEVSISSRTFPEIAALARKGGVVGKPREAEPTDGEATPEEDSDDDDDAGPPAVRAITLRIKNPDPDPSSAHPLRKEAWQSTRTDALNGSVRFGAKYEAARHANIYVHVFLGVPRIRFADLPEPFEGTELQVQAMIDAMQPLRIAPMHLLSLAMRMWFQFNERDSSAEEKAAWNNRKLKSVLSLPRGVNLIHSELIALTRKGLAGERLPDEDFATYLYRRYDAAAKAWLRGLEDPLPTRVWFTGVGYDPPGTRPWDRTDIGTFITTAEPRLVHFVMGSRGAGVTDLVDPAFVSFFRPPLDGAEVDRDVDDLAHVQGGEVQALDLEALGSGPPAKSLLTPRMTIHDLRTAAKAGPDVRIIDEAGRTAPQIQSRAKILLDGAERAKRPGRGRRKPVPHMTEPGQAADPGHLEPAYLTTPKKRKRGDGEEPLEDEDELLPPEKRINASMLTIPVRTSGMRQGRAEDRPKQAVNLLDDAAKLVVDPMKVSKVTIVSEAGRTNEAIPMWRRQHFARALTRQLNRTPEMRLKPQNRYMPPRDNPGECLIVSANVSRFSRRGSDYKHVDRNLRLQGDKLAIGMPDGSGYDIYDPSAPGADEMLAKFVDLAEKSNVHVKERSVASHAGAVKLRVLNSYRNEAASLYIDLMRKYLVPAVMRGFDNLLMVPRESPRGKKYFASSEDLGSSLLNTQLEFMELFFFYFAKHANCAVLPMDAVSAVGAGSLTKITTFVDEWMRGKTLVAATSVDRVSRHSKRYEVAENWFESREDGFLSLHVPMHVARRFPNARVMLDQMCGPANVATFELHFPNEFRDFMRILDSYFNLAEDTPKHLLIPFLHCGPAVSQGCEIARQITHELVKNAEGFSAPNLATRYPKRWKRPPPETVAKQGERREGTRELMALAERAALRYPRAVIDVHAPYNSKQTADVLTAKAVLRPEEGMDISDGEQGKDDPDKDSDSSSSSSSSSSGSDDSSGNPPRGGASGASGNGGGSDRDGPDRRRGSGAGNSGDKKRKKKKPGKRKRHEGSASEEAGSEGEEGEQNGAGGGKKGKSRKGKGSRGRRGDGHGHQHGHQHGLRKQEHRKCPGKCYKRPDGKCVCDVACVCNCEECDHRSELEVFPTEDPSFHGFDPNGPWPDPPPGGQPVAPRNGPAPAPSARASRQDRSPSPVSERAVTPRAAPRVPPLPAADPFALRSKEHPGRFKRLGSPPPESSDKKLAPAPRPVPVSLPMLGMYDSDYNSDAEDGADLPKPAADQASAAAPRARSASGDEILSDRDIFVDAAEDLLRSPSSAPRGADVRHAPPPTDGPKPASKEPADKPPQVKKRKFDEIADQPDDRASEEPADEPSKAKKPKVNEPADQHDEFKCGRCKMKLKSAEAFAKHQAMHDNPPYCCTICGKGVGGCTLAFFACLTSAAVHPKVV